MVLCRLCHDFSRYSAPPSHKVQDECEVINEQHPIAEGNPVQAAIGQRELLMDGKKPRCHACDTELEYDKESRAIRECHVHQGIRLTPAIFQVE
jgi:hypothetical protein